MRFIQFVFVAALLFAWLNVNAQVVSCSVVNAKTKMPLAFVNVGVIGKDVGTVTNENGKCNVALHDSLRNDSLKFSMLGYKPRTFLVSEFFQRVNNGNAASTGSAQALVELQPMTYALNEVKIRPRKYKTKILGNQTESDYISGGFKSNQLGCEAGVLVKVKEGTAAFVKSFHASVTMNKYDTLFFRLNIYSLKDGMPFENILPHNIILRSTKKSGVIYADLTSYNILLEEDAVVTLEWIKDLGGTSDLLFSCSLLNGPVFYRQASQGSWQKENRIGLGFWLTVEQ